MCVREVVCDLNKRGGILPLDTEADLLLCFQRHVLRDSGQDTLQNQFERSGRRGEGRRYLGVSMCESVCIEALARLNTGERGCTVCACVCVHGDVLKIELNVGS